MSLQRGINLRALAEKMGQCSGAEVRGICTEAGMYALRERRQHVTQEDFEFAVAKVRGLTCYYSDYVLCATAGFEKEPRRKHVRQQALLIGSLCCVCVYIHSTIVVGFLFPLTRCARDRT